MMVASPARRGLDDLFDPLYAGGRGFAFAAHPARLHDFVYRFDFRRLVHGGQVERKLLADVASAQIVAADVRRDEQQPFALVQSLLHVFPAVYRFEHCFDVFRFLKNAGASSKPHFAVSAKTALTVCVSGFKPACRILATMRARSSFKR